MTSGLEKFFLFVDYAIRLTVEDHHNRLYSMDLVGKEN